MAFMRLSQSRIIDLATGIAGEPQDLMIDRGRLTRSYAPTDTEVDLDGRFVLPGLWDCHTHFSAWALHSTRIDLTGAQDVAAALALVAAGLDQRTETLVAVGLRDAVWTERIDTAKLDAVDGDVPVVVFTIDLHSAWLSTSALRRYGFGERADGSPLSGLLLEEDCFRVQQAVEQVSDATRDRLILRAEQEAAARGLVGLVDLGRGWPLDDWLRQIEAGIDLLRVSLACWPETLGRAIDEGMATGRVLDESGLITAGPLKIILDGSLSSRTAWVRFRYPDPLPDHPQGILNWSGDELISLMTRAERAGIDCAVHAIGDLAVAEALAAFDEAQAHGSIEHAQLMTPADVELMAQLNLVASVQPDHLPGDRAAMDRHWAGWTQFAFPLASLLDAGITLAFGSDAPVIRCEPWRAIRSAILRAEPGEPGWHSEQSLTLSQALLASTGGVGSLVPGGTADLMVLDRNPFEVPTDQLASTRTHLTMVGGKITHKG